MEHQTFGRRTYIWPENWDKIRMKPIFARYLRNIDQIFPLIQRLTETTILVRPVRSLNGKRSALLDLYWWLQMKSLRSKPRNSPYIFQVIASLPMKACSLYWHQPILVASPYLIYTTTCGKCLATGLEVRCPLLWKFLLFMSGLRYEHLNYKACRCLIHKLFSQL
jgi:hypothetical protein